MRGGEKGDLGEPLVRCFCGDRLAVQDDMVGQQRVDGKTWGGLTQAGIIEIEIKVWAQQEVAQEEKEFRCLERLPTYSRLWKAVGLNQRYAWMRKMGEWSGRVIVGLGLSGPIASSVGEADGCSPPLICCNATPCNSARRIRSWRRWCLPHRASSRNTCLGGSVHQRFLLWKVKWCTCIGSHACRS
jgi:hypothetical protein